MLRYLELIGEKQEERLLSVFFIYENAGLCLSLFSAGRRKVRRGSGNGSSGGIPTEKDLPPF